MNTPLFEEWNEESLNVTQPPLTSVPKPKSINPCSLVFGYGPLGVSCRACVHLLHLDYHAKTYIKCDLRKITHGAGSDHRLSWPACARFEERKV